MATSVKKSDPTSRTVVLGTTILLGVAGIALIFAPVEIAGALGLREPAGMAILIQLYGAALFGLGMTGWMVKDSIIGGVFGRSYVVGNAAHSVVGALILIRPALAAGATPVFRVLTAVYCLLAIAFAYLMFIAAPGAKKLS
ncbi:MAG: hypothetical protein ABI311_06895 [Gemmatimonadaceae bacterium]